MNHHKPFSIRSRRLGLPDGIRPGILLIRAGRIENVLPYDEHVEGNDLLDLEDLLVFPGLIDCYVHLSGPGRSDWQGFDTGTRAAAAGGITTLEEIPWNLSQVATTPAELQQKIAASEGKMHVNCAFWGGVIPGNESGLDSLLSEGALGLNTFLSKSGMDDFPDELERDLRLALQILKKYQKPLLVQYEIESPLSAQAESERNSGTQVWLDSRPDDWEIRAIELLIRLCRETGVHCHIVHLATHRALPLIEAAKKEGLPLTVETCPHYLLFDADAMEDGLLQFQSAQSIRKSETQDSLWQALANGTLDFLASDQSPEQPSVVELKRGDFSKAWADIAGLQFSLTAFWEAAFQRGFPLESILKIWAEAPARFIGLDERKGRLAPGYDADIVVWNPEENWIVSESDLLHQQMESPYLGRTMRGRVKKTFVDGRLVYDSGRFLHLAAGEAILK